MSKFKYPLDALLRKHKADWKTVKVEEVTASQIVDRRNDEVTEVKIDIGEAEQILRELFQGGTIDVARQEMLSKYLLQQRAELEQRYQALQQAKQVHERVAKNLEGIGRGIKSLEKHRGGKEVDHRFEQGKLEQKQIDELWLLRQSKNEG